MKYLACCTCFSVPRKGIVAEGTRLKTPNIKPMAPEHIKHMHIHHIDTHMYKEETGQVSRAARLLNDGSKPRGEGASSWERVYHVRPQKC